MRHKCGTSTDQVRIKCGSSADQVRSAVRIACGTPADVRRRYVFWLKHPPQNTKTPPKSTKHKKRQKKTPNFFFRLPGCLRVPVVRIRCGSVAKTAERRRHRCGTGAAPVRNRCGSRAERVRNGRGTGAERVRNAGGTGTERRRNGCGTPADLRRGVLCRPPGRESRGSCALIFADLGTLGDVSVPARRLSWNFDLTARLKPRHSSCLCQYQEPCESRKNSRFSRWRRFFVLSPPLRCR